MPGTKSKTALAFSKERAEAESEVAEAKPFWVDFFNEFCITSKHIGGFEQRVNN